MGANSSHAKPSANLRRRLSLHFRDCISRFASSILMFLVLFAGAPQASESGTIEIYESRGGYRLDAPPPEMHPIVLNIPEQFLYGSSRVVPRRDWGANILTYYPSFTSPAAAENANFGLRCIGICNGRILISLANRAHSISSSSPNMGDFIARAQFKWRKSPPYLPNVHVHDFDPVEGFDEAFERVTTAVGNPNVPTERTYLRKAADGIHYDLTAICDVNHVRTYCILHFSLICNPAIYVSVNGVDGSYLAQAADIKEKVDRFVSAMVRNPPCAL